MGNKKPINKTNMCRWEEMGVEQRSEALQCVCGGEIQNGEHLMTECDYIRDYVDEATLSIRDAVRLVEGPVQREWYQASGVGAKLRAALSSDVRGLDGEVLHGMGTSVKKLVRQTEMKLRQMNQAESSWPIDDLRVWAPDQEAGWLPGAPSACVRGWSDACITLTAVG